MLLYEVKNVIKIFYEKENQLIIHEWLEYNPEDQDNIILTIFQIIFDLFLIYPVEKLIVKSNMTKGAFSPSMLKYIKNVQFPRLVADTKLRFVATVTSTDEVKVIGNLLWKGQFNNEDDVILYDVSNVEEGRKWLEICSEN